MQRRVQRDIVVIADDREGDAMQVRRGRPGARRRRSPGQSLVEFALVLPIFILLLAAMLDFGIGLFSYMSVVNAVRDGGRLGATNCSVLACANPVAARVRAASGGLVQLGDVTVSCTKAAGGAVPCTRNTLQAPNQDGVKNGDTVRVRAQYRYHMIWPLTFGTEILMTSTATFMAE
jgi:Flp pilus assembly protein TadG